MANQKPNQKPKPNQAQRPKGIKRWFGPTIRSASREPTAGGVVWRRNAGEVQFLMIQDSKDRWTLPKGHIEPNERPEDTAIREVKEETGLKNLRITGWLGKINFRYRRQDVLVLMTTNIYLIEASGDTNKIKKEDWMNSIGWFNVKDTLELIEYEDMYKLILLAQKKIRDR